MSQNIGKQVSGYTNNLKNKNSKNSSSGDGSTGGFWDIISNNEGLFMFVLLIGTVIGAIILSGLFISGPTVRDNLLFNAAGAIGMGILFVYIIFKFLGAKIRLLGVTVDVGLTIYVLIVCFVIFVLGG